MFFSDADWTKIGIEWCGMVNMLAKQSKKNQWLLVSHGLTYRYATQLYWHIGMSEKKAN